MSGPVDEVRAGCNIEDPIVSVVDVGTIATGIRDKDTIGRFQIEGVPYDNFRLTRYDGQRSRLQRRQQPLTAGGVRHDGGVYLRASCIVKTNLEFAAQLGAWEVQRNEYARPTCAECEFEWTR